MNTHNSALTSTSSLSLLSAPLLKAGQVIIFEGDSLTRRSTPPSADIWPLLRMNNWHHSYAEIVEDWLFSNLPALNLKARHCAIGGSTIDDLLVRYETHVKPNHPDWIIFTLGTNDSRRMPLEAFREKLTAYVQTAQRDANTRFFFCGGFLPMPGLSSDEAARNADIQPFYNAAREVILASGGLAPLIGHAFLAKAQALHAQCPEFHSVYGDGIHLNALGNNVLAGLVLQALGAYQQLPPLSE